MNTCKTCQTLIEHYIEGCLDTTAREQLNEHIKDCPACRDEFARAESIEVILKESLNPEQSHQPAIDAVMTSIAQIHEHKTESVHSGNFYMGMLAKVAAGFLLIAAVGLGFLGGRYLPAAASIDAVQTAYQIQAIEGTVLVRHPGTTIWQPLTQNSAIYVGDEFLSTPQANVTFVVDDQSTITLSENSMLVLNTVGETTELHLAHGSLDAALESPHGLFFVTTPHGRAEALGTEFTVNVK